jgi:hypothetical protein
MRCAYRDPLPVGGAERQGQALRAAISERDGGYTPELSELSEFSAPRGVPPD